MILALVSSGSLAARGKASSPTPSTLAPRNSAVVVKTQVKRYCPFIPLKQLWPLLITAEEKFESSVMEEGLCTLQAQCVSTSNRHLNCFGGCHGHRKIFENTITKEPPTKPQHTKHQRNLLKLMLFLKLHWEKDFCCSKVHQVLLSRTSYGRNSTCNSAFTPLHWITRCSVILVPSKALLFL